jgi:hypothetical protein
MTAYETIMVFIAILSLLEKVSSHIVTIFTYFNKNTDCISRTAQKKPILSANKTGGVHKDIH